MSGALTSCVLLCLLGMTACDWETWGPWRGCSRSCGRGGQLRRRTCQRGTRCFTGSPVDRRACNEQACPPCLRRLRGPRGRITSPHYPDDYDNNMFCTWSITGRQGQTILLVFEKFGIERSAGCRRDSLSVYDGPSNSSHLLLKACGARRPEQVTSTGYQMYIEMKTDAYVNQLGFVASFVASTACGPNESHMGCEISCSILKEPYQVVCDPVISERCLCKRGLYRSADEKCVKREDCPETQCPANSTWVQCATGCPRCDRAPCFPSQPCKPGCDCNQGFKKILDGPCVAEGDCPPLPSCPDNEIYHPCRGCDEATCEGTPRACASGICRFTGCTCDDGFVRFAGGPCMLREDCPTPCPTNETFQTCRRCDEPSCKPTTQNCVANGCLSKGCSCMPGYARIASGHCIKQEDCVLANSCPYNEQYNPCRLCSEETCAETPVACADDGCPFSGCTCAPGTARVGPGGPCVRTEECQAALSCPANQEYSPCQHCGEKDCDGTPVACSAGGGCILKGCVCVAGFVRIAPGGYCVKKEDCEAAKACSANEVYSSCWSCDEDTCKIVSPKRCVEKGCVSKGCTCAPGFARIDSGHCIQQEDCAIALSCPVNEQYSPCRSCTEEKCDGSPVACASGGCAFTGCSCAPGFARLTGGPCVRKDDCAAAMSCPINERFDPCRKCSEDNCEGDMAVCTDEGCPHKGCTCVLGYARLAPGGPCIRKADCGLATSCPANQEFNPCWLCSELNCPGGPIACGSGACLWHGCTCKLGFVRVPGGGCVRKKECPASCPSNEEYKTCRNCDEPTCADTTVKCTAGYCRYSGCTCRAGYVRSGEGRCIRKSACPTIVRTCPTNEVYHPCRGCDEESCTDNPLTCASGVCRYKGCTCLPGYVRNADGVCQQKGTCLQYASPCRQNEVFNPCRGCDEETCSGAEVACTSGVCRFSGCTCAAGFLRNDAGQCVEKADCPSAPLSCRDHEVFTPCKGCDEETCAGIPATCPKGACRRGCICADGYVRGDNDRCVRKADCPSSPRSCPSNQIYNPCRSCEEETCAGKPVACYPGVCRYRGCTCAPGYVRDADSKCVLMADCQAPTTRTCPDNEEDNPCRQCDEITCENFPFGCVPGCPYKGCTCKFGFVRNGDGQCVRKADCPTATCDQDEVYKECGSKCSEPVCGRRAPQACPTACESGCFCRPNYARNQEGVCVRARPDGSC